MSGKNNCIENHGLTWKETLGSQGKTTGDETVQWAKHQNTCQRLKGKTNQSGPSSSFGCNFTAGTGILTNRCQLTSLGIIWARMGGKELKAKLFIGKQNSSLTFLKKIMSSRTTSLITQNKHAEIQSSVCATAASQRLCELLRNKNMSVNWESQHWQVFNSGKIYFYLLCWVRRL